MSGDHPIHCGSFELVEPVGEGGMASVWRARHRRQDFPVALKVIEGPHAHEDTYHEAFRREVIAQAGLEHPGIVTVFEYGTISEEAAEASEAELVAGSPYFALEYAEYGTLRGLPRVGEWRLLRLLLLEILDALAYAHARGVIHRDLKPANILYFPESQRGQFRLTDFGLAHVSGSEIVSATEEMADAAAGTPHYMPPEQIRGQWRRFGPWTDLYALGCLTYECLHGELPFDGENFATVATQQLEASPPPIEPDFPVPDELATWVQRLLTKDDRHRFRRAADAARQLGRMPAQIETSAPRPEVGTWGTGEDAGPMTETRILTDGLWDGEGLPADRPDPDEAGAFESARALLTTFSADPTHRAFRDPERDDDGDGVSTFREAPSDRDRPPLPADWRYRLPERPSARFVDIGLDLFGIREVPFVAREEERDRIWSVLRDVCGGGGLRAVEIAGPAGIGTTRLADWMARRAHELGGVTVMRASHSPNGGPTEGLPAMVESALEAWELDREETYERVAEEVEARYDRLEASERGLDEEARALTEIIYPTPGGVPDVEGPRYHFESSEERFAAIARLLEEFCDERPVVLVLDDIQWGHDAIGLVDYLFEHVPDLPILVLETLEPARLDRGKPHAALLDQVRSREGYLRLELESLAPYDQRSLVERLLPIADEPADYLVHQTEGIPLFAIHVIGEWIARGALEPGDGAFSLASPGVELPLEELGELWNDRIEGVVVACREAVGDDDARRSLELAAALGRHVDLEEWRAVCERAGVEASDAVYERLIREGLAEPRAQGWSFVHPMLVEAIDEQADRAGRWQLHNLHCAETLSELYAAENARAQRRRAEYLAEAGETERAEDLWERFSHDESTRIGDRDVSDDE